MLFVGHFINEKKKASTIRSYVSAIKTMLKENRIKLSEDKYLISSLTKACSYRNDQVYLRLPIRKYLLNIIVDQTWKHFEIKSQYYLSILYSTVFMVGYYGLLRIREVATGSHPILAKDVQIAVNKKKWLFILRTSKMHWKDSKPQMVRISSSSNNKKNSPSNSVHCPYETLKEYVKLRNPCVNVHEPFFVFSDNSAVAPHHIRMVLTTMLTEAGFPVGHIHSTGCAWGEHQIY